MSRKKEDEGYRSKADRVNSSRAGRRKKKQRREALLVAGVLVFVLVVAVLSISAFMKVAFIQVENVNGMYTDDEIVAASGLKNGDSLMRIGKKAVNDKICRALPYVGEAKVKISIPDTVLITVIYTEATMCIHTVNGYVLLDNTCKVLQTNVTVPPENAAELLGTSLTGATPGEKAVFDDPDMYKYITELASSLEKNGITGVTGLNFIDLNNVVVEINYSIDVKLGSVSKAAGKLKFGKEVIDRTLAQNRTAGGKLVIDLTVEDSAYVRSQDSIEAASESRYNAENGIEPTTAPPPEDEGYDGEDDADDEAAYDDEEDEAEDGYGDEDYANNGEDEDYGDYDEGEEDEDGEVVG